jgi:hypothetical protein
MEAAIVRPHRWPFSTHYFGQPRLCLSTIIGTDSRPLSALAHPPPPRLYIDLPGQVSRWNRRSAQPLGQQHRLLRVQRKRRKRTPQAIGHLNASQGLFTGIDIRNQSLEFLQANFGKAGEYYRISRWSPRPEFCLSSSTNFCRGRSIALRTRIGREVWISG